MDVIGGGAAFRAGLTRYFTGKPCKRGHLAERMVSNGACVLCLNETRSRWRKANSDKLKCRDREAKRTARAVNPERERLRLDRFYAKREARRVEEAGRPRPTTCEVCDTAAVGRIVWDHCHASDAFRGWICDRCNKTLGMIKDNPALLRALADYLERAT